MALLSLLDINLSFGGPPVLENLNFQVDPGERVCLLGRNGSGKTTLMRVIAGELAPDRGEVFRPAGAVCTRLTQEIPAGLSGSVHDLVWAGLRPEADHHEEDWQREMRVEDLLGRMGLEPAARYESLSGGLKRRALLARALAGQPDLLLLDEPTNHLDLASILWLEEFLLTEKIALFFVTHDRAFLRRLATRIVELDRGRMTSWACDYDTYLLRKEELLQAEEKQQAAFDKKLAQEEAWARRRPGAQRKRIGARRDALKVMRAERAARRTRAGNAVLQLAEAEKSGVKVIEAENLSFGYPGGPLLLRDFSTVLTRGDKLGLIGPNGAGKTTFIKLLLGELAPTAGTLKHGTRLEVLYFDQHRAQIDDDKTVADNVADGNETVTVNGRTRHVISYLQDFLFEPDRARTPARVLSGGERNRLLLARLFTKPANVLVLDEPTNDLDAETLDLLEDLLVEYQGTLLVVSHDRDFLDNVVTGTLVFEGEGHIGEYVGGYTDWTQEQAKQAEREIAWVQEKATAQIADAAPIPRRKLTNKERSELAALPARIEALEQEQVELTAKLADPQFYKSDPAQVTATRDRLAAIEQEHHAAYVRWEELEARE